MKKFLYLFISLLGLYGCMEDYNNIPNPPNPIVEIDFDYDFGNNVQRTFYGQVLDRNGNPISGATVSAGSAVVQTTTEGFFMLKDASVKENFAHLKITKTGFIDASRVLIPTAGENRVNVMMIPATTTSTISSGTASTVSLPDGTSVQFDGSFKDASGNPYTGNVNVAVFNLATSDTYFNETMPGSLLASYADGQAQMLESYGMMHVQLTGDSGQELQIANGHTAQITYPIDSTQASTAPATIPLWSFNEDMGIWVEEGSATKVGNNYVGNVSHFSWWNCDVPNQYANLQVTVTDSSNQPLVGLTVGLKTTSMTYELYSYTNGSGVASGTVIANQPLEMNIYDLCGSVIYTGNVGPFANASSNNISAVASATVQSLTITGTLQDCSGSNVTDGFVELNLPYALPTYFQNNFQMVSNGNFNFSTIACTTSPQFTLTGYDYTNLQTTGAINFTGTVPTTNVGTLTACNAVNEFINYQIDNQSMVYCIGTFNVSSDSSPTGTYSSINHNNTTNPNNPLFGFSYNNVLSTGLTLTSNYTITIGNTTPGTVANAIPVDGTINQITFQVNSFGNVGDYVDFTFSGVYNDSLSTPVVQRTIVGTGHVKRDF